MDLRGWKYEGRKISDSLHVQMLTMMEILNDPAQVNGRTWGGSLQTYIGDELGISSGQVRTIKRMMEEFNLLKKGALNRSDVPSRDSIYTKNGEMLLDLFASEKLMKEKKYSSHLEQIKEIKSIYKLYYQGVLIEYNFNNDKGDKLHPLKATLKAVRKFEHLDYWEWYILNTIITQDDNIDEEKELEKTITEYRNGKIKLTESDIKEYSLSHSYVLGNFVHAGFLKIEGRKEGIKIFIESGAEEIINNILKQ
ncbi:hypothetical protein [Proteiniclasticum ruminis]|uniref:hypothetical protein n=1 Tax=Proteiniclasticum ruminis TaxID=398199 RepID=UPI0028A97717|nr:hypothetical protein [Proteiniclasticum ruminis]